VTLISFVMSTVRQISSVPGSNVEWQNIHWWRHTNRLSSVNKLTTALKKGLKPQFIQYKQSYYKVEMLWRHFYLTFKEYVGGKRLSSRKMCGCLKSEDCKVAWFCHDFCASGYTFLTCSISSSNNQRRLRIIDSPLNELNLANPSIFM